MRFNYLYYSEIMFFFILKTLFFTSKMNFALLDTIKLHWLLSIKVLLIKTVLKFKVFKDTTFFGSTIKLKSGKKYSSTPQPWVCPGLTPHLTPLPVMSVDADISAMCEKSCNKLSTSCDFTAVLVLLLCP